MALTFGVLAGFLFIYLAYKARQQQAGKLPGVAPVPRPWGGPGRLNGSAGVRLPRQAVALVPDDPRELFGCDNCGPAGCLCDFRDGAA